VINRERVAGEAWIIFTCGAMGAGKGYAMSWLSQHGLFELENLVHIDMDYFRRKMPEWEKYKDCVGEQAGSMSQKEAGFIQEIAQEAALQRNKNVWVDGSLGDWRWYTEVFKDIKTRFPNYRIAIFHVYCSQEQVLERARKRGEQTGRMIPEDKLKESIAAVGESVEHLRPHSDFFARINNEERRPRLDMIEDRTHSFAAIQTLFGVGAEGQFPTMLPRMIICPTALVEADLNLKQFDFNKASIRPGATNIFVPLNNALSSELKDFFRKDLLRHPELQLVLSPSAEINLDFDTASRAGIPKEAAYFSYCFGGFNTAEPTWAISHHSFSREAARGANNWRAEALSVLVHMGGFVYFDHEGAVLQINISIDAVQPLMDEGKVFSTKLIQFGKPMEFNRTVLNRWVHTQQEYRAKGSKQMTWLLPNENEFAPFGCFLFEFGSDQDNLAFPVTT